MNYVDIDSKINWTEFYGRYLKSLKRAGKDKMSAICPFHDEHHNSFWFNTKNGCWKCEACGQKGNAITFLERKENISPKDAYKKQLKEAGEYKETAYNGSGYTLEDYCSIKSSTECLGKPGGAYGKL